MQFYLRKKLLAWLMSNDSEKNNKAVERINQADFPEETKQIYRNKLLDKMENPRIAVKKRFQAGNGLAVLGDPRFREDIYGLPNDESLGFIRIPAGKFWMGSKDSDVNETSYHQCDLKYDFYIAKYPVTVRQWRIYEKGIQESSVWRQESNRSYHHPVVRMGWNKVVRYCDWLDTALRILPEVSEGLKSLFQNGWHIGLPSEAEWEKAARGTDGRNYPYGNKFNSKKGNTRATGIETTSAVGCFTGGESPYGCLDMSGNVWEWTRSIYKDYPYVATDGRENLKNSDHRVLRGGSFFSSGYDARCAYRLRFNPLNWFNDLGFRICLTQSKK